MKRTAIYKLFLVASVMSLTACSASSNAPAASASSAALDLSTVTLEKLHEANMHTNITQTSGTFKEEETFHYLGEDDDYSHIIYYGDQENLVLELKNSTYVWTGTDFLMSDTADGATTYSAELNVSTMAAGFDKTQSLINEIEYYKIAKKEIKDGNIVVTMQMSKENTKDFFSTNYEYEEGDVFTVSASFDPETLIASSIDSYILRKGGTKVPYYSISITLGNEMPDALKTIKDHFAATADTKTVTCVVLNGEHAGTYKKTIPAADKMIVVLPSVSMALYSDEACTVPFDGDIAESYTVYGK